MLSWPSFLRRDAEASISRSLSSLLPFPHGEHTLQVLGIFFLVFNFHLLRKQIYIFNKRQTKYNKILKTNTCKLQHFPVPSSAREEVSGKT